MADIAAHLVDRVLPAAPYRLLVLSFPWALRFHLALDTALRAPIRPQAALPLQGSAHHEGHEGQESPTKPLCASIEGFSLHAASAVGEHDREGLERLCRYGLPKRQGQSPRWLSGPAASPGPASLRAQSPSTASTAHAATPRWSCSLGSGIPASGRRSLNPAIRTRLRRRLRRFGPHNLQGCSGPKLLVSLHPGPSLQLPGGIQKSRDLDPYPGIVEVPPHVTNPGFHRKLLP